MAEIKKINVDGVDYDIVSESAEKKIAELEKNNTALASVTFGTRNAQHDPILVGFGTEPGDFRIDRDIFIGNSVVLAAERGVIIGTGSFCPLEMNWTHSPSFEITGGYNNDTISIDSDAIRYNGVVLGAGVGTSPVESHDGTILSLGTGRCSIIVRSSTGQDLQIGTGVFIGSDTSIGRRVAIGYPMMGDDVDFNIQIGTSLQGEKLHIKGPVYLEAKSGGTSLTIGKDGSGYLEIDWRESDKIVFTNLKSGKKATLTLS